MAPEDLKKEMEANQERFNTIMHLSYGSSWGVARGALDLVGMRGLQASLVHFGAVWATAQGMLPAATETPPITEWSPKQIASDVLFHAVYAFAAGAANDAMGKAED